MDNIWAIMIKTAQEIMRDLAKRLQAKRLALALTQKGLELRSGVSLGTIKRFERTGSISLESLLKLGIALGVAEDFELLFSSAGHTAVSSLDDLLKQPKTRRRGSVT